ATAASAIVDRLVHHSTLMQIRGDSYRLRSSKVIKMMPPDKKSSDKPKDSSSDQESGDQPTDKPAG
ncbi:MAG: ATP-binding protein, partial [Burkholderiales bacterium]|nr:ATP-binding protein [Burkholderiales bacterium]